MIELLTTVAMEALQWLTITTVLVGLWLLWHITEDKPLPPGITADVIKALGKVLDDKEKDRK